MDIDILPGIPRIYTALAEWLACVQCIHEIRPGAGGGRSRWISLFFLIFQSVFLILTRKLDGFLWIVCMAAAVLSMYLFIRICSGTDWKSAGYYCARAFVVAEFAASLE